MQGHCWKRTQHGPSNRPVRGTAGSVPFFASPFSRFSAASISPCICNIHLEHHHFFIMRSRLDDPQSSRMNGVYCRRTRPRLGSTWRSEGVCVQLLTSYAPYKLQISPTVRNRTHQLNLGPLNYLGCLRSRTFEPAQFSSGCNAVHQNPHRSKV